MKTLVIIPAYNEEMCIADTVRNVRNKASWADILVINDCSSDGTQKVIEDLKVRHLRLPVNLGIGGAVQAGYRFAVLNDYDIAVQIDADGQHDPSYLEALTEPVASGEADLVIGSRFIDKEGFQSSKLRQAGIRYFTRLIKSLSGVTITDPTSGMRMCNRKTIEMFANEYPRDYPEPESTMRLLRHKRKVIEMPVKMRAREEGVSSISSLKNQVYYMIKVTIAIVIEKMR